MARLGKGLRYSQISPGEAPSPRAGNRFDVLGGGVLYGATDVEGCYRETLARLRPAPGLSQFDEDDDSRFMRAGQIAASWRQNRRLFRLALVDPLPFVDVEHQHTWNVLDDELGLPEDVGRLDVGTIRGPDRTITRAIANWVYTQGDLEGALRYGGIRYVSRTGDFECWAIFDGGVVQEAAPAAEINLQDAALQRVAADFRLTLHGTG